MDNLNGIFGVFAIEVLYPIPDGLAVVVGGNAALLADSVDQNSGSTAAEGGDQMGHVGNIG